MKAKEIFEKYTKEYRWLTKDSNGWIYIWSVSPYRYIVDSNNNWGWWNIAQPHGYDNIATDKVDEFDNLDWKACIIERDKVGEETFTKKDMINFIEWTNVIYRDLSHTIVIKDVNNVEQLL